MSKTKDAQGKNITKLLEPCGINLQSCFLWFVALKVVSLVVKQQNMDSAVSLQLNEVKLVTTCTKNPVINL